MGQNLTKGSRALIHNRSGPVQQFELSRMPCHAWKVSWRIANSCYNTKYGKRAEEGAVPFVSSSSGTTPRYEPDSTSCAACERVELRDDENDTVHNTVATSCLTVMATKSRFASGNLSHTLRPRFQADSCVVMRESRVVMP